MGNFRLEVDMGSEEGDVEEYGITMEAMVEDLERKLGESVIGVIVKHAIRGHWVDHCQVSGRGKVGTRMWR